MMLYPTIVPVLASQSKLLSRAQSFNDPAGTILVTEKISKLGAQFRFDVVRPTDRTGFGIRIMAVLTMLR
jgi:hypothetical protein